MKSFLQRTLPLLLLCTAPGCDYIDDLTNGSSDGGTETVSSSQGLVDQAIAEKKAADEAQASASIQEESAEESSTVTTASTVDSRQPTSVTLSAFSDFNCTSNWTNRDGALGLQANSGSGTCQNTFSGVTADYRITLTVQTEFDGKPYYSLSINAKEIAGGQYPLSSSLACDCPHDNWRNVCPDQNIEIDAGVHTVAAGDSIEFFGEEDWECDGHGAYAKWHSISFVPLN